MKSVITTLLMVTCLSLGSLWAQNSEQVSALQYYYNTDPGVGNAGNGAVIGLSPVDTLSQQFNFNLPPGLPLGVNHLYLRVQDTNGNWSLSHRSTFFVASAAGGGANLTALQYFFDNDPGVGVAGNGAIIGISPDSSISQTLAISLPSLSEGVHSFYLRTQNQQGNWSLAARRVFYVASPASFGSDVSALQYYFDQDPGLGQAGNGGLIALSPDSSISQQVALNLPNLAPGIHYLYIRAQNQDGEWSPFTRRAFYVYPAGALNSDVSRLQYFFDQDPGVGVAGNGAILNLTADSSISQTLSINLPGNLAPGLHYLQIRVQNQGGRWSLLDREVFFIAENNLSQSIDAMEYFVDSDPGEGLGIPIPITPGDSVNGVFQLLSPCFPQGSYELFIRARSPEGIWSIVGRDTLNVDSGLVAATISPPGNVSICNGDSVKLSFTPTGGATYQWRFNGVDIPAADSSCYYATVAGNYTVMTSCGGPAVSSNVVTVSVINSVTYFADTDNDGFGDPNNTVLACGGIPVGFVNDSSDCDDTDSTINPAAIEICDGLDNNCDGQVDEGTYAQGSDSLFICQGDSLLLGGVYRRQAGVYLDTVVRPNCDSVVAYLLIVHPVDTTQLQTFTTDPNQAGVSQQLFSNRFGCDSLVITTVIYQPPPCTVLDSTLIVLYECDSAQTGVNQQIFTGSDGCDSIVTTLTIFDPGSNTTLPAVTICEGDSALIFGVYRFQAGFFSDTLPNRNGCDSVRSVQLLLIPIDSVSLSVSTNDSSLAGVFDTTYVNRFGCDSVVTTTVIYVPAPCQPLDSTVINRVTCDAQQAGVSTQLLTGSDGCDSLVTTVTVYDPGSISVLALPQICAGDSALIFGLWRTVAGSYYDTLPNQNGCDSVLVAVLSVNPVDTVYRNATTSDSTLAGVFDTTYVNQFGCDSTVITTVIYLPLPCLSVDSTFISLITCDSSLAGVSVQVLVGSDGCDSVLSVQRIFDPGQVVILPPQVICQGDSALIFGVWQTTGGVYYDSLLNQNGCDSVQLIGLSLNRTDTVYRNTVTNDSSMAGVFDTVYTNQFACDSTVITTVVYHPIPCLTLDTTRLSLATCDSNLAGLTNLLLTGSDGCDSIHIIERIYDPGNLVILGSLSICEGDSSLIFGRWQSVGGTYYDSLLNQNGCDSVRVLSLVVNPVDTVYRNASTSDSTLAGVYDTTYTNRFGCDSTVITTVIYLPQPCAILDSTFISQVSCDSNDAGVRVSIATGSDGCDSVVVTTIIYDPGSFTSLTSMAICQGDSLLIFGHWRKTAATYYDSLSNRNGCDSVIAKTLSILPIARAFQSLTICRDDSIFLAGAWQSNAGTYYDTLTAANGCDSIVESSLSVNPQPACVVIDSLSCVSDSSWLESTVVTPSNRVGKWLGVSSLPPAASFSFFATEGQPYIWGGVKEVDQSRAILSLSDIRYFKKSFNLLNPAGYNAHIQMYMDDGTEVYINGHLLAREENMAYINARGRPHDLVITNSQMVLNGYLGNDPFDWTPDSLNLDTVLQAGVNEIVVVLRNPGGGNNIGGFSFRLELNRNGITTIPTKLELTDLADQWQLYPNPSSGMVQLQAPAHCEDWQPVAIFDLHGQLIRWLMHDPALGVLTLDLRELPPGPYQLRLGLPGQEQHLMLIRE